MPAQLNNLKEYQNIFHWAETQKDGTVPSFALRENDPYEVILPEAIICNVHLLKFYCLVSSRIQQLVRIFVRDFTLDYRC